MIKLQANFDEKEGEEILKMLSDTFGGGLTPKTLVKYGLKEWKEIKKQGVVSPYMEIKDICNWTYFKEHKYWKSGCNCKGLLGLIPGVENTCPSCGKKIIILPESSDMIEIERKTSKVISCITKQNIQYRDYEHEYNPETDALKIVVTLTDNQSLTSRDISKLSENGLYEIRTESLELVEGPAQKPLELEFRFNRLYSEPASIEGKVVSAEKAIKREDKQ